MSCTVVAIPYALYWVIGSLVTAAALTSAQENKNQISHKIENFNSNCDDIYTVTEEHFIEKEFETPFMDKNILLKTLKEHGVREISEINNKITGSVDGYELSFTKYEEEKPYILKIIANENANTNEKVKDLNSEYATNVQEDAYLHILDKLKENNMTIEEEIVEDDNTIVLTVNIDG